VTEKIVFISFDVSEGKHMGFHMLRVLVTGGAGFIGSHLAERLVREGHRVVVLDNLSSGRMENVKHLLGLNSRFSFVRGDLKSPVDVAKALEGCGLVFHFAANPEVRVGETDPEVHFRENLTATFNLLEGMRKGGMAKILVFASTSTVYGEASELPTPEDYGPMVPISTYGASKLGCEALISSYAYVFGLRALILRLANVVGERCNHGVVADFVSKLRENGDFLEILGDGSQEKSYLQIGDCVDAVLHTTRLFMESERRVEIYNVGSLDQVTVGRIAEVVAEEMELSGVKLAFTGGVDGGRGWKGDVKKMMLSVGKLLEAGWKPKFGSEEAVRFAARSYVKDEIG